MKTTYGTIFVTSFSHFLKFDFFLIFQNQSTAGNAIQQIKKKESLTKPYKFCGMLQ